MGRSIDLKKWKRREHFELFRRYEQPFFSVTVEVDITSVWRFCEAPEAPSFLLTTLFLMLRAANATEAFRLRLRKRGVWRHDSVAVGPTIFREDETFSFARIEPDDNFARFVASGAQAIVRAKREKKLPGASRRDDLIYHSTLPWLRFTAFTNALRKGDSIPRIVFGKCVRDGQTVKMPVAIEVHHAVVDGLDVARFMERFQSALVEFPADD